MVDKNDATADSIRARLNSRLNTFSEDPSSPGTINSSAALGMGNAYVNHKMKSFLKPKILAGLKGAEMMGFVLRVEPRTIAPSGHVLREHKQLPPNPTPDVELPKLIAIKVRVPVIHSCLMIPSRVDQAGQDKSSRNHFIIDLYPTFYARTVNMQEPKPMDVVKVTCSDWFTQSDPIYEELMSDSSNESMVWAPSANGGEFKNSASNSANKKGTMKDTMSSQMTSENTQSDGMEEEIVTKWLTFKTPHPETYGETEVYVAKGGPRDESGGSWNKSKYYKKPPGPKIKVKSHTPLSFIQGQQTWPMGGMATKSKCTGKPKKVPVQRTGGNPFGARRSTGMHTGEDVYVPPNTPIYAPFDLTVISRGGTYSSRGQDGGAILTVQPKGFEHITIRLVHVKTGKKGTPNENIKLAGKGDYKEGDLLGVTYYAGDGSKGKIFLNGCRTKNCGTKYNAAPALDAKGKCTNCGDSKSYATANSNTYKQRVKCDAFPGGSDSHLHLELNVGGKNYKKSGGKGYYGDLSPYEVFNVEKLFVPTGVTGQTTAWDVFGSESGPQSGGY